MKQFYIFSGLQLNCAKCDLFSFGVSGEKLLKDQQAIGFELGTLPVQYLGVHLIIRRLTKKDYILLVDKITAKINH